MADINEILAQGGGSSIPKKWQALLKSVPANKTCGLRAACVWTFDNVANEPDEIDKTKVPSRGAVRLLIMAQGAGYAAFLQLYQKAVAEKGSAEAAAEDAMRQRQLTGHLDKWMDELDRQSEQSDELQCKPHPKT